MEPLEPGSGSTAFFAALAGVLLVVGGGAALQAAHLALACGEADALGRHRAGSGFAVGFGSELLGHVITPVNGENL